MSGPFNHFDGRSPSQTGIAANTWYDRKLGKTVYCVSVPDAKDKDARGPQNMFVTTLGDWVKAAIPGSHSFAVSGKDRAAITMGTRRWCMVVAGRRGHDHLILCRARHPGNARPGRAVQRGPVCDWRQSKPVLWPQMPQACATLARPHTFGKLTLSGEVPPRPQ